MTVSCRPVAWLAAAVLFAAAARADEPDAASEPQAPPDPAQKINAMFVAGEYRAALAASEPLEKKLKPSDRDPQLIPKTKLWVELMTFRGSIERRLGNLEGAAAKYEAAFRALNDKDLRRAITGVLRGGEQAVGLLVPLELTNLEVLDGRVDVLLDRLANRDEGQEDDPELVAKALAAVRKADGLARAAREGLVERLAQADENVRQSPYSLMLASTTRPLRAAGRLALAESRLAAAPPAPAADDEPKATPEQAVASLDEAIAVAEAAMAPALPAPAEGVAAAPASGPPPAPAAGSPADLSPAVREAGLVRADLLAWRAEARRAAGKLNAACGDLAAAVAWRRAVQGSDHVDLVEPLTSFAELAFADARVAVKAGDIAAGIGRFETSQAAVEEAGKLLAAHEGQFPEASALPQRIESLRGKLDKERKGFAGLAGDANSIDAAATRALRLLDWSSSNANPEPTPP